MILHKHREHPGSWPSRRTALPHAWLVPLLAVDFAFDWLAYFLSRWSFLEVLEYLGSFSVLIAVIFYFSESGDRLKQKHYQAWQVINTAQGAGGSGGRIEALQELDQDGVALVGVNVSGAFLQGVELPRAKLVRSDFSNADVRNGKFELADLAYSNLHASNFRGSDLSRANLQYADLGDADFCGANLRGADFSGATLDAADLGNTDLADIKWQEIKSLRATNIRSVRHAPDGFIAWAMQRGAVTTPSQGDCR